MKRAKVVIEFITLVIAGFVAYFTYNIMLDTGEQAKQNRRAVDQTEYALRYQREKDSLDRFGQDKRDALSNQSLRLRDSIGIVYLQTEMRAYISVKLGRDVRPMGSSIEVPWIILNTGKTPAINARLNKGISAEQFPEQDLKR